MAELVPGSIAVTGWYSIVWYDTVLGLISVSVKLRTKSPLFHGYSVLPESDTNLAEMHGSGLNYTVLIPFEPFLDDLGSRPFSMVEPSRFSTGTVWYGLNRIVQSCSAKPSCINTLFQYLQS